MSQHSEFTTISYFVPLGVSNFSEEHLHTLIEETDVIPAVNQVEVHPLLTQTKLLDYCQQNGIVVTAYSTYTIVLVSLVLTCHFHRSTRAWLNESGGTKRSQIWPVKPKDGALYLYSLSLMQC